MTLNLTKLGFNSLENLSNNFSFQVYYAKQTQFTAGTSLFISYQNLSCF